VFGGLAQSLDELRMTQPSCAPREVITEMQEHGVRRRPAIEEQRVDESEAARVHDVADRFDREQVCEGADRSLGIDRRSRCLAVPWEHAETWPVEITEGLPEPLMRGNGVGRSRSGSMAGSG
jgi:hypothetical protein